MSEHTHIIGAKRGNQDSFDSLYQWLMPRVYRYAMVYTGSHAVAEEIVSESFMAFVSTLSTLPDHDLAVLAWMRTVVRRRAVDQIRSQAIRREKLANCFAGEADPTGPPDDALRREQIVQVRLALTEIPEDHREVLELRYIDGCSLGTIAETLELTSAALNSRLYRARETLRKGLG